MVISEYYDINKILLKIEAALQIDGKDYSEKDIEVVLKNIRDRIIRQYHFDLTDKKITDTELYISKRKGDVELFVENIAQLHAMLCGYLQIVRYTRTATVRMVNINYMAFTQNTMEGFFIAAMNEKSIPSIEQAIAAIKRKFGVVNNCIEKKLVLIMIVCYEFGLYEMVATIAEIFRIGTKL